MSTQAKVINAFFILFMSIAIFALAIKGDGRLEFLTIHYPPVINAIKSNALILAAGMLALATVMVLDRQRFIKLNLLDALLWFFVYKLILGARLAVTDNSVDLKQIVSFVMIVVLYFLICCRTGNYQDGINNIIKIIFISSALLCVINDYNILFNYSGASWKGRFLGVYTHPNFLAVNHAVIVAISIGYWSERGKGYFDRFKYDKMICLFNLVSSLVLIVLSGSRTGIVGLAAALAIYGLLNYKKNLIITIIAVFAGMAMATLFVAHLSDLAQQSSGFSRIVNGSNTRAGVWGALWRDFVSSPLIGVGSNSAGTAGSYLQVLSIGGLMLFIPFILMLMLLFKQCFYNIRMSHYIFIYPIASLIFCAISEGILAEGASFPMLMLLLVMTALSFSRKRDKIYLHALQQQYRTKISQA